MFYLNWPVWIIIPQGTGYLDQLVSLNKVLADSRSQIVLSVVYKHSRTCNVIFKLTSLYDYPSGDGQVSQTGQFILSLDSFYVTDSPLSVTNIEKLATIYLNWPVWLIIPQGTG